jgi:methylated-DNA-protein-cysteine methyltransferase related protein
LKLKNYIQKVFEVVKKIPEGKVTTYGAISKMTGVDPRMVGWALHTNKDGSDVPCHRVVNKDGRLAPGYAFGGPDEQKMKLLAEGIKFRDTNNVDSEYIMTPWRPQNG